MVAVSTLVGVAVDGLAFGVILAILGVGITLVFGLGDVLNLAIGTFAVIAVIAANVMTGRGWGLVTASIGALVLVAVLAVVVDRTLLSLVYRSEGEERILLGIFTTLGLAVLLDGTIVNYYSSSYSLPLSVPRVTIGDVVLRGSSLTVIVVGAILFGVMFLFLRRTFLGKATRTVFQDEQGARLVGVNPRRIRTLIFVLSIVVAGLAGIVFAIRSSISVASGFELTVFALIVSIVGGVRSLTGAIAAGVFLGFVNQFANFFVGSYIATVILFGAAIVVLLAKPGAVS